MKFRKKPLVVEAWQWNGQHFDKWPKWAQVDRVNRSLYTPEILVIDTLEGQMYAELKYWIIQGIKGEIYSCKPDVFEATYERVEE